MTRIAVLIVALWALATAGQVTHNNQFYKQQHEASSIRI